MKNQSSMQQFQITSYLSDNNAAYIEALYEEFLHDPNQLTPEWRTYFQSLSQGQITPDVSHQTIRQQLQHLVRQPMAVMPQVVSDQQSAVDTLIEAYRRLGHLSAHINPLGPVISEIRLQPSHYGLTEADLTRSFDTRGVLDKPRATLKDILEVLKRIYCGSVDIEYGTNTDEQELHWLRDYVEHRLPGIQWSAAVKRNILKQLVACQALEKYLDAKYVAQTRFSLEGGDSLIPLLDEFVVRARQKNVEEMVICMAHRGRINVLINIMGQSPAELFQEFEGTKEYGVMLGDVKYHRGYSRDVQTEAGPIHLSLAFNPSHLEFIFPVVMGSVRARQARQNGQKRDYAMPVMIHGDAAFVGEGVVMETLSMSQTKAYYVGGTVHVILNNQIGFTISDPRDARSSLYCSDPAKMLDAPIFHVNGDDPEAVVAVAQLALDYRMMFHKDVFIDLVCYRRHGHQESDDPVATQPLMYKIIQSHPTTREIYTKQLVSEDVCTLAEVDQWVEQYRQHLDQGRQWVETLHEGLSARYAANWTRYLDQPWSTVVDTSVPLEKLQRLGERINYVPDSFTLRRSVANIVAARKKMLAGEIPLDWGCVEMVAYATLLVEGHPVRLVGEDTRRGTFFHRHATLFDQNTGQEYEPLRYLGESQADVHIYDSLLSECGALGFEYGYSTAEPNALVIWEAQYGDFVNVAQVIIDQFISSGWQKWNRLSGVVLFLPHGYQGAGPEHSSARLERFLQLCAQKNMQVCIPTTPAQIFHLLRRQVLRPYRKPLIIMSPKSLLRHKLAVSDLKELTSGSVQLLIPEIDEHDSASIARVILCSGKIYYDLLEKRREEHLKHIAILRIEQLYPFPYDEVIRELQRYSRAQQVIWCQEEPKNQGAWFCTRDRLTKCLQSNQMLEYVGRPPLAAPAGGYYNLFRKF